jgi:polyvinyl alcohol dehydrogenase (cytochrome)
MKAVRFHAKRDFRLKALRRVVFVAVLATGVPALVTAQQAPNGEVVYRQHCASCHEGSLPRMPSREALRAMTPEAIETTLSSFFMRRQGAALSPAERRAVAAFLTGRPAGSYRAPLDVIGKEAYCAAGTTPGDPLAGPAWNGWGNDARNSRSQTAAAAGLTAADIPKLKVKWAFGMPGVSGSGSQITVVGSRAFVGSRNGIVYALDAKTGCLAWAFEADTGVRSTPVVGRGAGGEATVYFGDANAQVYALDAATGTRRWKVKVEDHLDAMITGGLALHNGRLYLGVSSLEEGTAAIATYECCTFRGSVVALDASTGKQIWKTYTVSQAPQRTTKNAQGTQLWGPSGGAIWSQPMVDADRNRIYVGTGDNYSKPPTRESDAIMALAMDTGRILWVHQALAGDSWNVACFEQGPGRLNCPEGGPDFDFGSSPALAVLPDGRRIIVAGQKSGALLGLNPDTGEQLWKTQAGDGGILGGIEWGFAVEATTAYVSLSHALEKKPGEAGGLVAVNLADGKPRWTVPPTPDTCNARPGCNTGQPAAVSSMPGVIFSGSLDGHLRAYESASGKVLWDVDTMNEYDTVNRVAARGGSMNGPGATIVGGMVFVSSGYGSLGFVSGNVIIAFSVDGK